MAPKLRTIIDMTNLEFHSLLIIMKLHGFRCTGDKRLLKPEAGDLAVIIIGSDVSFGDKEYRGRNRTSRPA